MNIKDEKRHHRDRYNINGHFNNNIFSSSFNHFTSIQKKNTTKLNRETEAMYYAVDTIENIKSQNF